MAANGLPILNQLIPIIYIRFQKHIPINNKYNDIPVINNVLNFCADLHDNIIYYRL